VLPSRPDLAPSYGILPAEDGAGLDQWSTLSAGMAGSRTYWIATADLSGNPHTTPIWGVWLDNEFHFGLDPGSKKARNLALNPRAVVHLESGDDVVILECTVAPATSPGSRARILSTYRVKYDLPDDFSFDPILTATPRKAYSWRESNFPGTATRFLERPLRDFDSTDP
jgi:hypothetical protein